MQDTLSIEAMLETLPDYAKDLRLNWSSLVNATELSDKQKWGSFVAAAYGVRSPRLLAAVEAEAANHVSAEVINGAKGAGAIMGMNNIYYRFQHLSSNEKYATIPARLRMNIMRTHGADHADFELWSLVVSAINGCGKCIDSHEKVLLEKGVTEEAILAAVRIAAVVHGTAAALDALV
ncbi:MAG TPA: carboxymuconolactone decarboxylase family protein [Candidatus Saccharimonadales bacterium]|nr:carboxymuconolactone decarboxylase family protein [Candidatus Saccharimonadales bacterium]